MKYAWIIFAVLIAAGGIFLAYRQFAPATVSVYNEPANQPPGHGVVGNSSIDQDPFDITILYTDEGFSPVDVTITQGERVRFLNEAGEGTWPASGVHPTHSLYPEKESSDCLGSSFDACTELKKGEFYDFTFKYVGDWRFHDHVHPYNTGSITVVAPTSI